VAVGRDDARLPSRCPPAGRRLECVSREPASGEQPRDHRIRVPHLARSQLVPSPDQCRHRGHQVEQPPRQAHVSAQGLRTRHRLGGVGNDPVPLAAHLVSKQPKPGDPAAPNRAFHDHPTRPDVGIGAGPGALDSEPPLRYANLEGSVVEVERPPPLATCLDGLVDSPVHPNQAGTPRAEGNPVQVDAGLRRLTSSRLLGIHAASLRRAFVHRQAPPCDESVREDVRRTTSTLMNARVPQEGQCTRFAAP